MTTWTDGVVVTAAQLNAQIRDVGNFWLARPTFLGHNNAGVSCTSGTATLLPWDTELEDNDAMHSTVTNPSRVICNTLMLFNLQYSVRWIAATATSVRTLNLRLNAAGASGGGTSLSTRTDAASSTATAGSSVSTFQERNFPYRFVNLADYLELFVTQNTGGALSTDTGARVTAFFAQGSIA